MIVYTKEITVTEEHLDQNKHVNNVQYVKWVEEMATEHWECVKDMTKYKNDYWVMYDHHIQYKKQVFLGDKILVKTYPLEPQGLKQPRKVEFYKDGVLMVDSKTLWVMCDHKTHKIVRIEQDWLDAFR